MCERAFWYHPTLMYKRFMSVFNPLVLESSPDLCLAWEGCISNDDNIALVERPKRVKVKFWNL
jgi:peptide deformylase